MFFFLASALIVVVAGAPRQCGSFDEPSPRAGAGSNGRNTLRGRRRVSVAISFASRPRRRKCVDGRNWDCIYGSTLPRTLPRPAGRLVRSIVAMLASSAAAIRLSLQPSPASDTSAFQENARLRQQLRRNALPLLINSSSWARFLRGPTALRTS